MMDLNAIGLPIRDAHKMTTLLNGLLAQYQMHYQNLRGFHWNIKGKSFFELHVKFEEYYSDAQLKIDEVAERILTLGNVPFHTFEAYINESEIVACTNVKDGKEAVTKILEGLSIILKHERPILELAAEMGDDGTADLMTQFISQQEKEIWMLSSWLSE